MRNDVSLKNLRPKVNTEQITSNVIEQFQNEVLRPILKYQHSLLELEIVTNPLLEKIVNQQVPLDKLRLQVKKFISQTKMKNQFFGQVSGLMTNEEFQFYKLHKKEIDKRIFSMVLDRIISINS